MLKYRRVSLSNLGSRVREIELTSYAEVVLTQHESEFDFPNTASKIRKQNAPVLQHRFREKRQRRVLLR